MAEIKNLNKASRRIKQAIKDQENIVLYGDTDLDGTSAVIILEETIKNLGRTPSCVYFPDREKEGYGLNKKALQEIKQFSPGLLILQDCGISNFKEIEQANKLGFEVIILDHHNILNQGLPKSASIIVDPKQKTDKYPFKFLSAAGISFKLSEVILKKQMTPALHNSFLELTGLAALADRMPKTQDNRFFIEKGLQHLKHTFRPGLRVLLQDLKNKGLSWQETVQRIILLLQISENKNHKTENYTLLTAPDLEEAKKTLDILQKKYQQRNQVLKLLTKKMLEKHKKTNDSFVFDGGEKFPYLLAGALASRLCNKLNKPIFIFYSLAKEIRASIRAPKGINSVEALEHCSEFLDTYGGHPPASGFSAPKKNTDKIRKCLEQYFNNL